MHVEARGHLQEVGLLLLSLCRSLGGGLSNVGHQTSKASLLLHYLTSPKDAFRGLDHDSVGVVLA